MQKIFKGKKSTSLETNSDSDSESRDTVTECIPDFPQEQAVDSGMSRLDSFSSVTSIYSADGSKEDYTISGKVMVGIWHKDEMLYVRVIKAEGLRGVKSGGISDPYVKTYLLPDKTKHTKRKTGIQRCTTNPVFNETLKYKLPSADIKLHTLWLSLWDWDKFGRNIFLGEVKFHLGSGPGSLDLTDSRDKLYQLKEKGEQKNAHEFRGRLNLAIKYSPYCKDLDQKQQKGTFFMRINEAAELPIMEPGGSTDAVIRIYLLPKCTPYSKRKTKIIKGNLNPVWNEEFEYKFVSFEDLKQSRMLELTVWDYDRRGCNDFIGSLHLGPDASNVDERAKEWIDSTGDEIAHWEEMMAQPGEWVERWHDLRPSIRKREVVGDRIGTAVTSSISNSADRNVELLQEESSSSIVGSFDENDSPVEEYHESKVKAFVKRSYEITGELNLYIKYRKRELFIIIQSARGLAAADKNGFSDPYVNCYLLPDKSKHSMRKTDIKWKTLEPVFKKEIQYEVEESQLSSRTLWFTVWDKDRISKDEFLGEVKIPLSTVDFNNPNYHWYPLKDVDAASQISAPTFDLTNRGKVELRLMFEPIETKKGKFSGKLYIHVKRAESLPNMNAQGLTDGFVSMLLLPEKSSKKKMTRVINNDLNPVWDEQFTYEQVTFDELSKKRALELTVWDHNLLPSKFIGGLRLGPASKKERKGKEWMDSNTEEARHWENMLVHMGEWVESWHSLRPSMDYKVQNDLTTLSLPDDRRIPEIRKSSSDETEDDNTYHLVRGSKVVTKRPDLKSLSPVKRKK